MKFPKRLGIYLPVLFILIIAATSLRTVALFTDYQLTTGYFDNKLLISIGDFSVLAGCVFMLSFLLVSPRLNPVASFTSPATYLPSGLISVSLLFFSAESFVLLIEKYGDIFSIKCLTDNASLALLISAALAILAVGNFLFTALFAKLRSEARAFFGILSVLFLCAYAIYLYFNATLPLNSEIKAVDQMAILLSAAFFLYEVRISLGREMWRCYLAFGMTASLLAAYSSVPTLIYYFAKGTVISPSLAETILIFTIFIYITARVIITAILTEDKKHECAEAIEILSDMRSEELSLPSYERINKNVEDFNTMGQNYEFKLHIEPKHSKEEADTAEYEEGNITDNERGKE